MNVLKNIFNAVLNTFKTLFINKRFLQSLQDTVIVTILASVLFKVMFYILNVDPGLIFFYLLGTAIGVTYDLWKKYIPWR